MIKKVFIITGQTATGKTKLALNLCRKYKGEIINADSRQIYKKLNIITGKDIPENNQFHLLEKINDFDIGYYSDKERNKRIWLYDIVNPKKYFSSFDFKEQATKIIKNVLKRKKTPIIVGGSYFYIYHLLYQINSERIIADWELRNKLNKKTVFQLQKLLTSINADIFNKLNHSDKNNPHRLIRRIEIISSRKNKKNNFQPKPSPSFDFNNLFKKLKVKIIGLRLENKEKLKARISKRVDKRLEEGAIKEVYSLLKNGYKKTDPGLKTIGYRQVIKYLEKKLSKKKMIDEWITREMQYAKRQLTFMKKDPNIKWKILSK